MNAAEVPVTAVLDDAADLARRVAAPWMGVLWLSGLPYRFLLVHFLHQAGMLGDEARRHGPYLEELAWAIVAALALHLLGRAVYVRACHLAGASGVSPGRAALRVPAAAAAATLYTGLLAEAGFWAFLFTGVGPVAAALFGGMGAAAAPAVERPGVVAPLRHAARGLSSLKVPAAFLLVFGLALLLSALGLFAIAQAVLWAVGGIGGLELAGWHHLLRPAFGLLPWPAEILPCLLLLAGAVTAVEPFWLAGHVVLLRRIRALETGEDLRHWFESLRAGEAS